jgi:hypothetical protein
MSGCGVQKRGAVQEKGGWGVQFDEIWTALTEVWIAVMYQNNIDSLGQLLLKSIFDTMQAAENESWQRLRKNSIRLEAGRFCKRFANLAVVNSMENTWSTIALNCSHALIFNFVKVALLCVMPAPLQTAIKIFMLPIDVYGSAWDLWGRGWYWAAERSFEAVRRAKIEKHVGRAFKTGQTCARCKEENMPSAAQRFARRKKAASAAAARLWRATMFYKKIRKLVHISWNKQTWLKSCQDQTMSIQKEATQRIKQNQYKYVMAIKNNVKIKALV